MIRLNVSLTVETEENRKKLEEISTELIELSLRDNGCIDYDLYKSTTNDDRYFIIETWNTRKDLEKHMDTEHYKRLAPQLQDYSTMSIVELEF